MRTQAERGRDGVAAFAMRETDPPAQIQPVAIREFAQAVEIYRLEQTRRGGIDRIPVDADLARHRRLVIAHAGDQVQQAQRALDRLGAHIVQRERRARQGHGFDQLRAIVEGVHQPCDAGLRIEAAAHEAERADRFALENPVIHSTMSSAGNARRL